MRKFYNENNTLNDETYITIMNLVHYIDENFIEEVDQGFYNESCIEDLYNDILNYAIKKIGEYK